MKEEKVKLHIDKVGYKDKALAKKEFDKIKVRVQRRSSPVEITLKELIEELKKGKAVSPAVMSGTREKDFIEQQVFMVDIDNKKTDIPILTVENAISICEEYHLPLAFYYFSFSHTEKLPKYRLVFVMNEVITDNVLRATIVQRFIELFEQADICCRNADRVFFGTNKEAVICDLESRITLETILKIPPKSIMENRDKKYTEKTDSELDKMKRDFDFLSYLKKRNGKLKRDTSIYAMFENCEICGHHDDLVYYYETNSFFCFNDEGNVGGSIIDYLMAVEHLTLKKAIKKFKKELYKMSKKLELICMNDIEIEEVKWLWYPYIPAGKVTILQGDPGNGKTHFALQVASAVTTECKFPTGTSDIKGGNIIFQTAEDGLGDTIKPRLIKAGADAKKVFVIKDTDCTLSLIDSRIEEAINEKKARLLIIDPLQAYLGDDVDMHRANDIRPIMHKLSDVAERTGCAIMLIGHMNKDSKSQKGIYKGLGSIDIVAAARSVLLLGRDPKNKNIRAVVPVKSSLAPEAKAVAFELNRDTGFKWLGESELTERDLLSASKEDKKEISVLEKAKKYILELLEDGDILVKEAVEILTDEGFSESTIRRAREELEIESYSTGFGEGKKGYWRKNKTDHKI